MVSKGRKIRIPTYLQQKYFWQALFGIIFIILVVYFVRNEKLELIHIKSSLSGASSQLIMLGIFFTVVYFILQAWLYRQSFITVGKKIPLLVALNLFLKRNLIGVLLPGGTFSSLVFFNNELDKYKLSRTQQYLGSYIFGLASTISIIIIAIPAFFLLALKNQLNAAEIGGFSILSVIILLLIYGLYTVIQNKNSWLHQIIQKYRPAWLSILEELSDQNVSLIRVVKACLVSVFIEITGVIHLYIALWALNLTPLFSAALTGYVVMVVVMSFSPFLKGLGAIELSVTYILVQFGYETSFAVSATLLFRVFEFWIPLIVSLSVFILRKDNLILRLVPTVLMLILGIINIVSVLSPAIPTRLAFLTDLLPQGIIHFTNVSVLLFGIALIILSVYLFLGSKNAWRIAVFFTFLSALGHLIKGIDYEESVVSVIVLSALIFTRNSYYIRNNSERQMKSRKVILVIIALYFICGVLGFYYLENIHFQQNLDFKQSFLLFIKSITGQSDLIPHTQFAKEFIFSLQLIGSGIIIYILWLFIYPDNQTDKVQSEDRLIARSIVKKYGMSRFDYFKTYFDKSIYLNRDKTGFLSYKLAENYAVVLENPVCENESEIENLIAEFKTYCEDEGLGLFFYRIPDSFKKLYEKQSFHPVLIGQEGIVKLESFTLEGKDKSSLRNAVNKIRKSGFTAKIYEPPLKDGLIQKLENVSDNWLIHQHLNEVGFSQGVFEKSEIKKTTVITAENEEEEIIGFINLIPDRNGIEGTYDLVRKTLHAPNGVVDFLIIETFEYFKRKGYKSVNMGLAALSGYTKGKTIQHRAIYFIINAIRKRSRFKGLHDFKEKFNPEWENSYLFYENLYDLIRFPVVLSKVSEMKSSGNHTVTK